MPLRKGHTNLVIFSQLVEARICLITGKEAAPPRSS